MGTQSRTIQRMSKCDVHFDLIVLTCISLIISENAHILQYFWLFGGNYIQVVCLFLVCFPFFWFICSCSFYFSEMYTLLSLCIGNTFFQPISCMLTLNILSTKSIMSAIVESIEFFTHGLWFNLCLYLPSNSGDTIPFFCYILNFIFHI